MKTFFATLTLLICASIFGLTQGVSDVGNVWHVISHPFAQDEITRQIIWEIRGVRVLAALLVGAALGAAGTLAQAATNNPLADPAILGTSAGAALGVLLGVAFRITEVGSISALLFALVGALLITSLVFSLSHSALSLITIGIGVAAIVSSIVGIAISALNRPDARSISFWSLGSLALVNLRDLVIIAIVTVIAIYLSWRIAPSLDFLSLGDAEVRHFGLNPQRIRYLAFALLSLLVASTVSVVGTISFLALAAPHIARFLSGPRNRSVIVNSAIIGALILVLADTAARSLFPPFELPIGLLTALIGAPILIVTLMRGKNVWR